MLFHDKSKHPSKAFYFAGAGAAEFQGCGAGCQSQIAGSCLIQWGIRNPLGIKDLALLAMSIALQIIARERGNAKDEKKTAHIGDSRQDGSGGNRGIRAAPL